MSVIKPFLAVRPKKEYAAEVAALPYDVMNSAEARAAAAGKPYSFLHVDKAEIDLPLDTDLYADAVYAKAAENLQKLLSDGICFREDREKLYLYRQTMGKTVQTGIVGCAAVDDYVNGVIKRHELTRADKEADRIRHVDTCNANTGPIFLAYRETAQINRVIDKYLSLAPAYDFVSDGGVRNEVWVIGDDADIQSLVDGFRQVESLYIADGHHRAASAVKVALKRREAHPDYTGDEEFNYFLAVYFRADELKILDYNRLIKDTNGLSDDELFEKLGGVFTVAPSRTPVRPAHRHRFGMYYKDRWYCLDLKPGLADENDVVDSLDVSILQKLVNEPIFGIGDPRTDKRIDFVGGIRGLEELEKRCHEDMTLAFSMYPTSLSELMDIADSGRIMPPKSTWFEPKLLSGLFIHELDG
ncbi:MAG: DUF1015 domain-containing protein [Clostridia bacterium]|nr:DUF1015 domain-containing protein [Clostridia bacterium]